MVSFTTILALSAAALAAPVVPDYPTLPDFSWKWHVTNWEAGCLGDGCYYGFDITVPSAKNDVGDITGVKAHCKGRENYDQSRKYNVYESCEILEGPKENGVAAKFSERKPDADSYPSTIYFSFKQAANEQTHSRAVNFTGSTEAIFNGDEERMYFDITPYMATFV